MALELLSMAREPKSLSEAWICFVAAHSPCRSQEFELEILVTLHHLKDLPSRWVSSSVLGFFPQFWAFSLPNHAQWPLSIPSLKILWFTQLVTRRKETKSEYRTVQHLHMQYVLNPALKMHAEREDWNKNYQMLTELGRQVPQVWFVASWQVGGQGCKDRKTQDPFRSPVMGL